MTRPHLLDVLRDQVLLCDGGMGSRVQALTLDVEKDYWNQENCTEILTLSRPDLIRDIHRGYTVRHFHEKLVARHHYKLGYTVTKLHLHRAGLVAQAKKRSAHRKKRPRRPMIGMMLHQDASPHAWLADSGRSHDLVVTLDDATGAIYSAFLVDEEGTASSFRGLREVVAN